MRIAIAGAGIAGLSAAIALSRKRFSVDLYERSPEHREVGAGIQLSPNAMTILTRLGIEPRLRPLAVESAGIDIRDGRSGVLLTRIPLGETARRRYGAPYLVVHRADLHAALLAEALSSPGVRLSSDAEVCRAATDGAAARFSVRGDQHQADVLVCADGVNSKLRQDHFGGFAAAEIGRRAWRGTVEVSRAPPSIACDVTGLWLGRGAHVVHYPVRASAELNIVVISGRPEHTSAPPLAGFAAPLQEFARAVGQWTSWPLRVVDPAHPWVFGRAVLIGDAAHAMAPSAAQGGAQAIEDAWGLAEALSGDRSEPAAALKRFEMQRRPRVERIARQALRNLQIYEMGGVPGLARNMVIRAIPANLHLRRLDWLYGLPAN